MTNNQKIYLLTAISFLVGASQFVIAGVFDKMAAFAFAAAIGTPIIIAAPQNWACALNKQQ